MYSGSWVRETKKTPRDLRGDLWGNLRGDLIAFGLVKKNVVYPNLNNLRLLSLFRHTHVVVPTTFNSNSLATHSCYCVFEHGGNRVITLEEFYDLKQIAANVVYHFQLYFHSPSLTLWATISLFECNILIKSQPLCFRIKLYDQLDSV